MSGTQEAVVNFVHVDGILFFGSEACWEEFLTKMKEKIPSASRGWKEKELA